MAELGLAGALVGLAGSGANLAIQLFRIADSIGSAAKESRITAADMSLFSQSLIAVGKLFDRPTANAEMYQIAQTLAAGCRPLFSDIRDIVEQLQPKDPKRSTVNVAARVKWVFRKSRVQFILSALASYKATLTLLVASMDLQHATETPLPEQIR
jgi:hypothetical protein